ncbi:hypothetical protein [Paenibacillus tarimensis]|uniref:hypothetical protein n=1 Tax=Paenibacillus tarimensis TaxID=416012 RepID=UPI001F3E8DB1|nr:hypothetical protein [Paenibacillus tarimensis]MCF2943839.1 hypothetical protein [Paenibacillus tarimensis]
METLLIIVGAAILVGAVVWFSKSRWKTIETARGGNVDALEVKNAYLKDKDIRSRVKVENGGTPVTGIASTTGTLDTSFGAADAADDTVYRLEVNAGDLDKAERALQQFEQEVQHDEGVRL